MMERMSRNFGIAMRGLVVFGWPLVVLGLVDLLVDLSELAFGLAMVVIVMYTALVAVELVWPSVYSRRYSDRS